MGQEPVQSSPRKRNNTQNAKKQPTLFERDPRLVEQLLFIPQLFAGTIDADIKRVQRLIDTIPQHILQTHIIDGINERFLKVEGSSIGGKIQSAPLAKQNQRKSSNPQNYAPQKQTSRANLKEDEERMETYWELQTQQRFLNLLKKLQHWYFIEEQLNNGMRAGRKDKKITIRKKIVPNYETKLEKSLYCKIFLRFYAIVLKKNLASKDRQRKTLMQDFHNSIGKMICEMLQHDHLSDAKLLQLSYKAVYLEKLPEKQNLKRILSELKQQFKPIYLTKQHSLLLKPHQYDHIKQITKCYLDELYLRSLKQAEDPDIVVDQAEGFGVVRNFPVLRVRQDKNR